MWRTIGAAAARVASPEAAHNLAIWALSRGFGPSFAPVPSARLRTTLGPIALDAPLGLAAGFDKNAEAVDGVLGLGAAFVEIGAVTPRPQAGNPKPRVFRLEADRAVINRLGFNNEGMEAASDRLRARRERGGVVGVNIGANANSVDRPADFEAVLRHFWGLGDFFTVNVSSPNTQDLRALQAREALTALLTQLVGLRDALAAESGVARAPLLVKIAPDLTEAEIEDVVEVALATGVDGVVATNTTIARPDGLLGAAKRQKGGLSGQPLFDASTAVLRRVAARSLGRLALIGVGGVETAEQALAKIRAGASAVQAYTGLIYHGPSLFRDVHRDLDAILARDGVASIKELVGADVKAGA